VRLARFGERRRDLLVAGYVDRAEQAADLRRDFFAALRVAVEQGDLRPAPSQFPRGGFAQARCRAGYDCGHPINVHCRPLSRLKVASAIPANDAEHKARRAATGPSQIDAGTLDKCMFIANLG
jgi:hypothetical protein